VWTKAALLIRARPETVLQVLSVEHLVAIGDETVLLAPFTRCLAKARAEMALSIQDAECLVMAHTETSLLILGVGACHIELVPCGLRGCEGDKNGNIQQ
jgi:hypothetical protein